MSRHALILDGIAACLILAQCAILWDVFPTLSHARMGFVVFFAATMLLPIATYIAFRLWGIVTLRSDVVAELLAFAGLATFMLLLLYVLGLGLTGRKGLLLLAGIVLFFAWGLTTSPERYDVDRPLHRDTRHTFLRELGFGFMMSALGLAVLGALGIQNVWITFSGAAILVVGPVVGTVRGNAKW